MVLCASGTATLEVMLVNRPLVMTYRIAPSTYKVGGWLKLVKLKWFSLPNILAGEGLIPEVIQEDATGPNLAAGVEQWLGDEKAVVSLKRRFKDLHDSLRCDASSKAANAVSQLLENRTP